MGLFKDMSGLMKQAGEMPRPGIRDSLKMANEAMQVYGDTARLQQIGVRGRATIHSVADTGATVNDNPVVQMSMTVQTGGGSYELTVKQPVQRLLVGMLRPGANLPVLIDPQDRERIVIDPQAPAEAAAQMGAAATAQYAGTGAMPAIPAPYPGMPAPAMPATPGAPPAQDASERLQRLGALRDQGLITDAEFEAQKAKILAEI